MLRRSSNSKMVGLDQNFAIYDDSESKSIIKKILGDQEEPSPSEVMEYINKLKNKLSSFDNNKTESENMFNNGYRRIWDCGNLVFGLIFNDNKNSFISFSLLLILQFGQVI